MSKELTSTELIVIPIEDQISHELVKANVTEAIIADLRERLLPLKISGIEDKETYLSVQSGRKECKALRVAAKKICTNGREQAVAISKAWIAKEKEVTGQIGEVEDYLEKQEKEYEAEVAKEKEARKRKQEEQLIIRQQALTGMGALYSDGNFVLGDISFDMSLIKESENDIWEETIMPKFKEEYEKLNEASIQAAEAKRLQDEEFKRQQEELEQKQKELAEKEAELKREADRQAEETKRKKTELFEFRSQQLKNIGFCVEGVEWYVFHEFKIPMESVWNWEDNAWGLQLSSAKQYVEKVREEAEEEKRKEQVRKDLQNKRYEEMRPFKEYGDAIALDMLWNYPEDKYLGILERKKAAFQKAEQQRNQQIAEAAAKKERERIEEEQRQAEVKRKYELRKARMSMLVDHDLKYHGDFEVLGEISEEVWMKDFNELKSNRDEVIRKQEEERKAEELAKSSDKTKWEWIITQINNLQIEDMRSGPYRKKSAILREKLEEIKAL